MLVRLLHEMKSTRQGLTFPAGQDLLAKRDDISVIVFHPDQGEKWIRVADRNIVAGGERTEPKPVTKAERIIATAKQISLF